MGVATGFEKPKSRRYPGDFKEIQIVFQEIFHIKSYTKSPLGCEKARSSKYNEPPKHLNNLKCAPLCAPNPPKRPLHTTMAQRGVHVRLFRRFGGSLYLEGACFFTARRAFCIGY